jgi:hypothetical protein
VRRSYGEGGGREGGRESGMEAGREEGRLKGAKERKGRKGHGVLLGGRAQ